MGNDSTPDDPAAPTCFRCAQIFRAGDRCAFCRDLHVLVFQDGHRPRAGGWGFEVWHGDERTGRGSQLLFAVGHFETAAQARIRAYEFIRRCVAHRLARGNHP